ncbi:MAG: ABC transporter ATP-binding protein [Candidatus Borkfalkiaceae bacterium]|nr:ABC transporter ATP-binding protein [Christensenellaceae bacterium]
MIEFENVTKKYRGSVTALSGISLRIREKGVYCLLGRNGAGKTTFMRVLAGRIPVSSGGAYINGKKIDVLDSPVNVAYIETAKNQFNMKIADLIKFSRGINGGFDESFALEIAESFGLDINKKYNSLSFGTKTMVTTMLALSSNKDVVLLDEPVLGFDPITRRRFYRLLRERYGNSRGIAIVSTHLIDEIADYADRLIIIDGGKIVLYDDVKRATEKNGETLGELFERLTGGKDCGHDGKFIYGKGYTGESYER